MYFICDNKIEKSSLRTLANEGFDPILLPPAHYLQSGVASHTDMLIFMGFGRLFCHKQYYEEHSEIIEQIVTLSGLELTLSGEPTAEKYPFDVLFNACIVGNKLICNIKTVSKLILDVANESGYEIIHVSQGYTKCSICVVSNEAIITADKVIAAACHDKLDVLLISEGYVSLPPYDYGFIGGASGLCGDKVYFSGSLDSHPNGENIKTFCEKQGKIAVSLSDGNLQDLGSLFFIK